MCHVPPPRHTADDLNWWIDRLRRNALTRSIPQPVNILDARAYSDASSGIGVAIVIAGWWRAWRVLPGWQTDGRDIGWLEAVGFELLVRTLFREPVPHPHLRIYGDNTGVVGGWHRGRSRNEAVNGVFKRVLPFLERRNATVHPRYVTSASNPADDPSRGKYPPASRLLPPVALPQQLHPYLVDWNAPITATEQQHPRVTPLPKPPQSNSGDRDAFNAQLDCLGERLASDDLYWWDTIDSDTF